MSRREFLKGALAAGAYHSLSSLVASPTGWHVSAAEADAPPARWSPAEPPNQPIGTAYGVFPGRVVWVHDAGIARWDGDTQAGGWYEDRFVNAQRADQMLCETLRLVTGAKTDAAAWKNLFRYNNQQRGRGDVGYQPGEKVVVKLNLNCCQRRVDPTQGFYNTPQLTQALLRQLVRQAGVREADLVVVDASRFVPDSIFDPCHAEFPAIRFEDRDGGEGRFRVLPDLGTAISLCRSRRTEPGQDLSPEMPDGRHLPDQRGGVERAQPGGRDALRKEPFRLALSREHRPERLAPRLESGASAPVDHQYEPAVGQLQRDWST